MKAVRIAVAGAGGKMGRRILALAAGDPEFQIAGALERPEAVGMGEDVGSLIGQGPLGIKVTSRPEEALRPADVLVDFTHAGAVEEHLCSALGLGKGMVIGTTGLSEETLQALRKASAQIPILQSPNMSPGVNLLFGLVARAAEVLKKDYHVEISEVHHKMKKDSPSGTALELARQIAEVRGEDPKSIAIHALREGEVVGEHTVSFSGPGETVEFCHRATSRDAFARGALRAAKFIASQKRGFYNMRDIL